MVEENLSFIAYASGFLALFILFSLDVALRVFGTTAVILLKCDVCAYFRCFTWQSCHIRSGISVCVVKMEPQLDFGCLLLTVNTEPGAEEKVLWFGGEDGMEDNCSGQCRKGLRLLSMQ